MTTLKERIVNELTRLGLMSDRIPYTHHHDYVRINADRAKFMSRAEVAELDASEDELYACALLQTVEGLTTEQKIFSGINKGLYYRCATVALDHLANLDKILGDDDANA